MDLNTSTARQLEDLIAWMREVATDDAPPPVRWSEVAKGLKDRALFTENYVLREIPEAKASVPTPDFLRGIHERRRIGEVEP